MHSNANWYHRAMIIEESNNHPKPRMFTSKVSLHIVLLLALMLALIPLASASNIKKVSLPKSKISLEIDYSDTKLQAYEDRLITLVDVAFIEYTQLFGGLPKKTNGEPYTKLKIEVYSGLGGGADPEYIEIGINEKTLFGVINWEIGLLHEMLHLWSAETFRYASSQEQWFNEGVTEYLTFRLATKLGLIEEERVLDAFAKPLATYLSASGIGKYSLQNAAETDQLKFENYFLVYHGGFVAGMVLDHQIRLNSSGEFSLDDLLRELYQSHSRDHLYSTSSIVKSLKKTTNLDFTSFFEKYIAGTEIIPVGHYFDLGALVFSKIQGDTALELRQQILSDMLMLATDKESEVQ